VSRRDAGDRFDDEAVALYGAEARRTIDGRTQWTHSVNTPYAGMELPGRVLATFLHGRATVLDGAPVRARES